MAISYEEALELKEALAEVVGERLDSLRRLREYWQGNFWDMPETKGGVFSIFAAGGATANSGPDVKLVRNFVQEICVKYQTYLSPLPMIQVPVDPPASQQRREQSVLKERALYGLWGEGNMVGALNELAWYLPLMGDAFIGVWPDFKRAIVRPIVRSPEHAYPVPSFDGSLGQGLDAILFSWHVNERWARRAFPSYHAKPVQPGRRVIGRSKPKPAEVEILEYSDRDSFVRWVDGQQVNGIQHDLGFNIFDQAQFIHVPGEAFGHGAVEQIVNLNELSNATLSLLWQSVIENVYPRLVLEDPAKAPEQIATGPGAVLPLNPGGKAYWLNPPVTAIREQAGFLGEMERGMKEQASMPDVNFGQFRASIVTGKAINELQGAGTGSTIEMVQGAGIGSALVAWNSKALYMLKRLFDQDTIRLGGMMPTSFADLNPKAFAMTFKGSQIVGSQRNVVVFSPAMDMHTKLVMQLQALGANLVSKRHARDQIGIPDSEAMEEEIVGEMIQQGVVETFLLSLQQGATPEAGREAERGAVSFIEGTATPAPSGTALPELPGGMDVAQLLGGGPGPGGPLGPGAPPAGGAAPPGALPPGPAAPPGGAPAPTTEGGAGLPPLPPELAAGLMGGPEEEMGEQAVTIDDAIGMFQRVQGTEGRVFLVGEIVALGQTDTLEVALTDLADRQAIMDAVPMLHGMVSFTKVTGEPDEPYIEVTPGTEPRAGGQEPDLAAAGIFGEAP